MQDVLGLSLKGDEGTDRDEPPLYRSKSPQAMEKVYAAKCVGQGREATQDEVRAAILASTDSPQVAQILEDTVLPDIGSEAAQQVIAAATRATLRA